MSGSDRLDPKAGPLGNIGQACFGSLDAMVKGYEPVLKGIGRLNLELMTMMVRRGQAWLETAGRIAQCKSPHEVLGEQTRFWQQAVHDYQEGSRRVAAAVGACGVMPGFLNGDARNGGPASRDYITFAEPRGPDADEQPKRRDRRAA
jgi:hypothetical protein